MFFTVFASAVDIQLQPGINYITSPITITKNHTRIIGGKNTRLIGGIKLSNFEKVSDESILNRLDKSIRSKVYQIDLKEFGITNLHPFYPRGYVYSVPYSHNHLYIDQKQMNIAQYPRLGEFINISSPVNATAISNGIGINDSRIYNWQYHPYIMAWGYWNYRWSGSTQKVTQIDKNSQKVYFGEAKNSTVAKSGDKIFFFNILEEIRYPGDFYIDNATKILYFLPFGKINSKTEIFLSNLTEPVIQSWKTTDIEIRDISIEATSHHGIRLIDCSNVTIDNVKILNIGTVGISITGKNIKLQNSIIHNTFDTGILLIGGDRLTLTKSNNLICNCGIYWYGNMSRNYFPAISLIGVGHTVRNCLLYNGPHAAITWSGNDHLIEKNDMHHIVQESTDAGVVYSGRDYTYRGNIFRNNYIHDVNNSNFIFGLYFDDCMSGAQVMNNIFYNVSTALIIGGGRDYIVRNNVFITNINAVHTDSRCAEEKNRLMANHETLSERYYKINGNPNVTGYLPPYSTRYENISKIDEYYKRGTVKYPLIPPSVIYSHNVFYNNKKKFVNGSKMNEVYYNNNIDAKESDFADFANGDYSIKKRSRLNRLGVEPIDMSEIGLIKEPGKGKIAAISIISILFVAAVIAIIIGIIVSMRKNDDRSTVNKSVDA